MIAIVESGSTKSDWRIVANNGATQSVITAGFNPYITGGALIVQELQGNALLMGIANQLKAIYFYGAGCSTPEMNALVADALHTVFPNVHVEVDHDLMGAALAASQGEESIICILGTGSNACYFNGTTVENGRPSLGYVLGDEAGGVWFGKQLIADYLHGLLPTEMHNALEEMGVTKEEVLQRVYREARPNTYLASFMPVLNRYRSLSYTQDLLHKGFAAFLSRYVCYFPKHESIPIHFVGSVAFFFQEELKEALQQMNLTLGDVVQHPVERLVHYHINKVG